MLDPSIEVGSHEMHMHSSVYQVGSHEMHMHSSVYQVGSYEMHMHSSVYQVGSYETDQEMWHHRIQPWHIPLRPLSRTNPSSIVNHFIPPGVASHPQSSDFKRALGGGGRRGIDCTNSKSLHQFTYKIQLHQVTFLNKVV